MVCPDVSVSVSWILKHRAVYELAYRLRLLFLLLLSAHPPPPATPSLPTTPPHPPCPPVCLASGSDTQYPHCVAVLQRGREKKSIYQQSLPSAALFCTHTKKRVPGMFQLKRKYNHYKTPTCQSLFYETQPVPACFSINISHNSFFSLLTSLLPHYFFLNLLRHTSFQQFLTAWNCKVCLFCCNLSHHIFPYYARQV